MIAKPFMAGLLIGLLVGAASAFKVADWRTTAQSVRQTEKTMRDVEIENDRRADIATHHETKRELIDRAVEEANVDFETYLQRRPDVRALDLGTEWLCIADRAAGVSAPRCAGEPPSGMPEAGGAGRFEHAGGAEGIPAGDPAVSDLRRAASRPEGRGDRAQQ
jgi:hypothetical protein